ncbi:AbrB family transcriptional regulator [Propylenella binzhouense]|uniref:AbrB family transcriptional regulator n=1 Tax=Propylenella binzhouense TaxID=2555902 RepID=UPI00136DA256
MAASPVRVRALRISVTLLAGAAGGSLASYAGLPAGTLSGSLLAVAIVSLAGFPTEVPNWLRLPVYLFLGIYAGTGVGPETIVQMRTWPVSFAVVLATLVVVVAMSYRWLNRWCGWDPISALLAAMPGSLAMVMATAESVNADLRKIAVTQTVRLLILIEIIPLLALLTGVGTGAPDAPVHETATADLHQVAMVFALGAVGGILLMRARLPGGLMLGGLIATAVLYLTSAVDGQLPPGLVAPATVVLGAVAGSRFRPGDWQLLPRLGGPAIVAFAIGMGISLAAATLVTVTLGVGFIQAFMAFAPGAIEALIIVAFALDVDPAYVAAHHVVRFFAISLTTPLIAKWVSKRPGPRG